MKSQNVIFSRASNDLGRCPTCMRKSFVLAVASYAVSGTISFLSASSILLIFSALVSGLSTALWVAHLFAYSARKHSNALSTTGAKRRTAILGFSKTLVGVALATAVPTAWAGSCSVTCSNGTTASNNCTGSQTCTCRCNANGNATCDSCS
jgi:Protein of unknown function (DUF3624).